MYDEVTAYSLTLGDPEFVHQLVVDAYAAQHATAESKPISVVFSVAGLYLVHEHGYTGRQVQKAHMRMAQRTKRWPHLGMPAFPAASTVADVLQADDRRRGIYAWSRDVWQTWRDRTEEVDALVRQHAGWI